MFKHVLSAISLLGTLLFVSSRPAHAVESVVVLAQSDSTLIEIVPTNNLGGANFFNAGTTRLGTRNRGLIRFDVSTLPAGCRILRAELVLEVIRQPREDLANTVFFLHRVLRPWGEGVKPADPGSPGLGTNATSGETTWLSRFHGSSNLWAAPGGSPGVDYSSAQSAEQTIYNVAFSPYSFSSSTQLVADVQAWVDDSSKNFGWMLRPQDETLTGSARSFGSSENSSSAPYLVIEFVTGLLLQNAAAVSTRFQFSFPTLAGQSYQVQRSVNLVSTNWQVITNLSPQSTNGTALIVDPIQFPQSFYRVSAAP